MNCKVLLVDDEKEFASTLAERLDLRGISVDVANSGEDALRSLSKSVPEVVILDLMMPGMNGLAVLERIKQDFPQIQVILLTGMGSVSEGVEGLRLGAFDYLMKPVHIEDLVARIKDAVSKSEREV
ncbi:response regulator [Desulfomonile tiedjei]|uniref:Response regulator with CheY-like receiver, AAA-type ATPase, and DNA-binding domains n=1 Tax=Desulfomonile tiedjei (strain ATCC 49306 / DSM 6799 / DCB-1) TaxID=706587 RepID=I4CBY7_DESTA|nr:response regulator [Desulfomonile tiedjei]AFM27078.1 response regulator with CheY-like receiver, AAA-type ATPase, and DNA-binding domains [Desulfomonile tiedjei DSM 6799]